MSKSKLAKVVKERAGIFVKNKIVDVIYDELPSCKEHPDSCHINLTKTHYSDEKSYLVIQIRNSAFKICDLLIATKQLHYILISEGFRTRF